MYDVYDVYLSHVSHQAVCSRAMTSNSKTFGNCTVE